MNKDAAVLYQKEGWPVELKNGKYVTNAYGREFPAVHPFSIYGKLYREETNPELKYQFFRKLNDYAWPEEIFHSWTEERYRAHCEGWSYITFAGGAACAKSRDAAKMAILFWLSDPKNNAVIIASTTLSSLTARIGGYVITLLKEISVDVHYTYMRSQPPRILYDRDDSQHGIFCVAAKQGDDDAAIKDLIGRHPKKRMMIVLDEMTDMPAQLSGALPNLSSGLEFFQVLGIGNSNSIFDLHGMMSTPKDGWESINPETHTRWETTQKNGLCLYFNPHNSPAIHETDPKRKKKLGSFLITEESLAEKQQEYGTESASYYRFVLGFWKLGSTDDTLMSKPFIKEHNIDQTAEWLGIEPLKVVAGLDVAFASGGDQCILRLAILGQTVDGGMVLDYRGDKLLFKIEINPKSPESAEIQISKQVTEILERYGVSIGDLAVDSTGCGRAMAGTIQLYAKSLKSPLKIYSTRVGNTQVNSFDCIVKTAHELWFDLRKFIENNQIKGMDQKTLLQLSSRLVENIDSKGKPCAPRLENKLNYKRRMGGIMPSLAKSPDEADAATLCLQVAMINYGFKLGQRMDVAPANTFFDEKMNAFRKEIKMEEQKHEGIVLGTGFGVSINDFKVKHSPFS